MADARFAWLLHPLAEALMRFNLLPSALAHSSREQGATPGSVELRGWHRHASAEMLAGGGFDAATDLTDPTLPLALLEPPEFEHLQLLLGASLHAAHIRKTIARDQITALKEQIGTEGMAASRLPAAGPLANLSVETQWKPEASRDLCKIWGCAVLALAFESASEPVAVRAMLRLPPETEALRDDLRAAGLSSEQALRACLDFLQTLEPSWVSSFPATP